MTHSSTWAIEIEGEVGPSTTVEDETTTRRRQLGPMIAYITDYVSPRNEGALEI